MQTAAGPAVARPGLRGGSCQLSSWNRVKNSGSDWGGRAGGFSITALLVGLNVSAGVGCLTTTPERAGKGNINASLRTIERPASGNASWRCIPGTSGPKAALFDRICKQFKDLPVRIASKLLHHKTGRRADVAAIPRTPKSFPSSPPLPGPPAKGGPPCARAPRHERGLLHSSNCFIMLLCSMNRNAPKTH